MEKFKATEVINVKINKRDFLEAKRSLKKKWSSGETKIADTNKPFQVFFSHHSSECFCCSVNCVNFCQNKGFRFSPPMVLISDTLLLKLTKTMIKKSMNVFIKSPGRTDQGSKLPHHK